VYRYVNRFTRDDAYPLPDISSVFQRIAFYLKFFVKKKVMTIDE